MPAEVLLPAWYRAELDIITRCPCQWGPCQSCEFWDHTVCPKALRFDSGPAPETYLTRHGGAASYPVWVGKPCRWVCPCDCPQLEAAPAEQLGLFDLAVA